jgi:hypothetical protein
VIIEMKMGIRKNKTAFSAVIASLILMLLAVAAGVVVYAYVMGWIGGAQQNPTSTGKLQMDSIVANVNGTGPGYITLYVRNVGAVSLTASSVYVNGVNQTNIPIGFATVIPVQGSAGGNMTISGLTLQTNVFYEVKVVCKDGTMVSTSVQAQ